MLRGLSEPLHVLVRRKYKIARESDDLVFSPSEATIIRTKEGIPFQLRYCPSLLRKPKGPAADAPPSSGSKKDPFDAPSGPLLVGHVSVAQDGDDDSDGDRGERPPTHVLVLNRFPIIANHFILATVPFKPQDAPLEPDDLAATHACLRAWEQDDGDDGDDEGAGDPGARDAGKKDAGRHRRRRRRSRGRRLIAFFNSGPASGASQPHRHVQFLPEENVRAGAVDVDDGHQGSPQSAPPWRFLLDILADPRTPTGALDSPLLPFAHFWTPVPADASADTLHQLYTGLLARAREAWTRRTALGFGVDGERRFSYNWAMVAGDDDRHGVMAVCPRVLEGWDLTGPGPGREKVGFVGVNGTVLAGTLMVKRKEEWDCLRDDVAALYDVLGGIGVPSLWLGHASMM